MTKWRPVGKPKPLEISDIRENLAQTCDKDEMRLVDALIATFFDVDLKHLALEYGAQYRKAA